MRYIWRPAGIHQGNIRTSAEAPTIYDDIIENYTRFYWIFHYTLLRRVVSETRIQRRFFTSILSSFVIFFRSRTS